MALFKTIQEVRKFVAVNASVKLEDLETFIRRAELLQIKPVLGAGLFTQLVEAYQGATPLEGDQNQLLEICQDCIANFASLLYIPHGLTQISSAGINQQQNATKKPATPEQIQKLENSFATAAYAALDELALFLDEKGESFSEFVKESTRERLVFSTRLFSKYVNIGGSRRTFIAIQPLIDRVENTILSTLLGYELAADLKGYHQTNPILKNPDFEKLLALVYPVVAFNAAAKAITELSLTISETGLHIQSSSSIFALSLKLPADGQRLENLRLTYQEEAENAEKVLLQFLYANIDKYTAFKATGAYITPGSVVRNQEDKYYAP